MKEVALLRCEAVTWDRIAKQYGYKNEDSARHAITRKYPQLWAQIYEKARIENLDVIEAEAIITSRQLMREGQTRTVQDADGNPRTIVPDVAIKRVAQSAAFALLQHASRCRATKIELSGGDKPIETRARLDIDVSKLSDAELLALAGAGLVAAQSAGRDDGGEGGPAAD